MIEIIDKAKKSGDSVGGKFEIFATGIPSGLGSYSQWFDRLQSKISESIMSINAIKGIEFGNGFEEAWKAPPVTRRNWENEVRSQKPKT